MSADTYVPIIVGLLIGAVGAAVVVLRSPAYLRCERRGEGSADQLRRQAVRSVLVSYAVITWFCLAVAVVVGEAAFIVITGAVALIASIGLRRYWLVSKDKDRHERLT